MKKLYFKWPLRSLAVAIVLCLVGYGVVSFIAEQQTFHPVKSAVGPSPQIYGLKYQDVNFHAFLGPTLRGWWIPGNNHRTVIMIHGWTSNRGEPLSQSFYLHEAGYNLLLFDLRGHGTSDGSYTTLGYAETSDVAAAISEVSVAKLRKLPLLS